MKSEPIKFKPHHAEGAQRFIAWGKNEHNKEVFGMLQKALDDSPNAELVFVRDYDAFCEQGCVKEGKPPPCVETYGSESVVTEIDEAVAREHGWEFDKPYKIHDILEELKNEAPGRKVFHICKLTHEEHEDWLEDVRRSKRKKS